MNICLCGAQSGYPHKMTCPFPYFGHDPRKIEEWDAAEARLTLAALRETHSPDTLPDRDAPSAGDGCEEG